MGNVSYKISGGTIFGVMLFVVTSHSEKSKLIVGLIFVALFALLMIALWMRPIILRQAAKADPKGAALVDSDRDQTE